MRCHTGGSSQHGESILLGLDWLSATHCKLDIANMRLSINIPEQPPRIVSLALVAMTIGTSSTKVEVGATEKTMGWHIF